MTDKAIHVKLAKTTKTYTTSKRAMLYGHCPEPSLVTLADGSLRWVPLPRWRGHRYVIYTMEA
jgi:hypothetical protein